MNKEYATKEFEFLEIIKNTLEDSSYLGDDCAYLREFDLTISTDSLIEDVHFKLKYMTPYEIARKAILANISDILASGAKPIYALINLSGSKKLNNTFIKEFYQAINDISEEYDLRIIGGDLTRSNKIVISITVIGSAKKRNISSRKHALPNYIVAVAGEFGSSAKGLIELNKRFAKNSSLRDYFINSHKKPYLQKEVSERIALLTQLPYAMMDSSDGLFDCLYQISTKSNLKIEIDYDKIPKTVDPILDKDLVLYGGEDYSLVVCLDENDFKNIDGLIQIGICKEGTGIYIDNKRIDINNRKGFSHF